MKPHSDLFLPGMNVKENFFFLESASSKRHCVTHWCEQRGRTWYELLSTMANCGKIETFLCLGISIITWVIILKQLFASGSWTLVNIPLDFVSGNIHQYSLRLRRIIMYQSIPKPPIPLRAIPGHLTLVKFRTVGNLTQKWGPPGEAFDFRVKTSVSSRKQKDFAILWFSRWAAFTGHSSCRFHVGFSVVVVLFSSIVEYAFV